MFLRGFLISFFVYRAEEKPARSTSKEFKNTEPRHVGEKKFCLDSLLKGTQNRSRECLDCEFFLLFMYME